MVWTAWENDVWGVSVYTPVGYSGLLSTVNETNCNKKVTKQFLWAPPIPFRLVPPWSAWGRMPSPFLLWKSGFCNLFAWLAVETVFERDSSSKIGSKSQRLIFAWLVQGEKPVSLVSFTFLCGEMIRMVFLLQVRPSLALLFCPHDFVRVIHDKLDLRNRSWIPVKCPPWESTFLQHLFHAFQAIWYPFCSSVLPCRAPWQRPFLITQRGIESIQSPLTKNFTGFAFNQEMSTSAIDHSLIPIKKTLRTLYFWCCFAQLEQLYIAKFTDHRLRIVAEWVVDDILLQIGLKCFSMRVTLRSFWRALELGDVLLSFTTALWQSWYSDVNVEFLHLGGLLSTWQVSPFLFDLLLQFLLRIDTQLWMYFDPPTGLSVLVDCLMSSWSNKISFSIPGWILVHPLVSPFLIIGFLVLVGFVRCPCCFQRLLNPIPSSNHLWRTSSVVVEMIHIHFSYMISPDSITTTFAIQQAGSVSQWMIALHLVW